LYILIIVLVLVVGIFVLRPMLTKKSAAPAKSATAAKPAKTAKPAAKGKAAAATDTGAVTAKAAAGKQKVKAAKGKAAAKAGALPAAQAAKPEAAQLEVGAVSGDTTPLVWQSDPFVRDWMLAGELRDMKVRAVTIGAKPLALINDRIVSLNDTISGKRVAAITRDSVVFEFGGQRRSLKIGE
jgi:nucleoid-associated protein YgaU